jgi:hypothetical protein
LSELEKFFTEEKGFEPSQAEKHVEKTLSSPCRKSLENILEAEKQGHLTDFHLHEPWHPKPFLNGNLVTFPLQHDSVIVYTGINKHYFFHEDSDKRYKKSRTKRSILETREIPGRKDRKGEGNYLGFLEVSEHYARKYSDEVGGAVLELQIPPEKLAVVDQRHREGIPLKNISELRKAFKNPEKFREECIGENQEDVHFNVSGPLKLEWVTGVWDVENSEKPVFTSLDEFVKTLKSQYGDHVSGREDIKADKNRKQILEEIEECKNLYRSVEQVKKNLKNFTTNLGSKEEKIQEFNNSVEKSREILEKEFGITRDKRNVLSYEEFKNNFESVAAQVKDAESGLKEALADEQQRAHETDWDREKFREEKFFEERVEERLGELILEIPVVKF